MKLSLISMTELYTKFPELTPEAVNHIREWMKKQPHLPEITDQEIAIHLHAKYFSVEAAKVNIDNDLTLRTHAKALFSSRDILGDDLQMIKDVIVSFPLPKLTPDGYHVLYWKLKDSDVTKFSWASVVKIGTITFETDILENGPSEGIILAIDVQGFTLRHLTHINLLLVQQIVTYMQETTRHRLKAICYFNVLSIFDKFLNIFKPLLNKDVGKLLKVYDSVDGLKELFPLELLPCDYKGGKADTIDNLWNNYMKYLEDRNEYFLEEGQTRRVNEKLRPSKSHLDASLYGMDGSFKQLSID